MQKVNNNILKYKHLMSYKISPVKLYLAYLYGFLNFPLFSVADFPDFRMARFFLGLSLTKRLKRRNRITTIFAAKSSQTYD